MMLAEQFRDLQLRQKEKFKARVTKLHSQLPQQRPSLDPATDPTDDTTMPGDDLGLLTATQERTNGALEPAKRRKRVQDSSGDHTLQKTVANFRQQVEQLKSEKAGLSSRLKSAEKQLEALRIRLQEEREILGQGAGGAATTQKIVELSKKNRLLHAELAAERNRSRQMERQVETATATLQAQEARGHDDQREVALEDEEKLKLRLSELQEELTQSKTKTTDYRNQCQILKQDLKLAHRVIAKEVGKGVTVSELLNSPSGWRGRSQQIITLQNKLVEMKTLLKKTPEAVRVAADLTQASREGGGGRAVARQKAALEKMDRDRKKNLEYTRRELESAQTECVRLHKECSALRARNRTLTEEVKVLKSGTPAPKRNRAMPGGGRELSLSRLADVAALELKLAELEQDNQLLRDQLQVALLQLKQNSSRLSTTNKFLSLPSLHRPSSHQTQPIRGTLSATVQHQTNSLREAQILTQIAEAERDKLLDLTMTLQQRLDSTTDQMARLKIENSCGKIYRLPSFARLGTNGGAARWKQRADQDGEKIEALEVEMEILRDDNTVLKETLAQLRQERLEDAQMFRAALENTKRMCVALMRGKLQTEQQ